MGGKIKSENVILKTVVPENAKKDLQDLACSESRTLSNYVCKVLTDHLNDQRTLERLHAYHRELTKLYESKKEDDAE